MTERIEPALSPEATIAQTIVKEMAANFAMAGDPSPNRSFALLLAAETMRATWRAVEGFEGLYEVSSSGVIRRVAGPDSRGHWRQCRELKPSVDVAGYLHTALSKGGKMHTVRVHRVVARAFLGPRPDGKEVNHIDGQKTNNAALNLEYITNAENQAHAVRLGLKAHGDRHPRTIVSPDDVEEIKRLRALGVSRKEVAQRFGLKNPDYITHLTGDRTNRRPLADALESYLPPEGP